MDAPDCIVCVSSNFIHPCYYDDLVRPIDQRCHPVAAAVDIDQLSIQRNGVGTHKIIVSQYGAAVQFPCLLRCFGFGPVDQGVAAGPEQFHHAAFLQGHTAAPGDDCGLWQRFSQPGAERFACVKIVPFHTACFQMFDQSL